MKTLISALIVGACAVSALASGPAVVAPLVVPEGTPIRLQLETHLSTEDNKAGDAFAGRVVQSVLVDGREVIPAGAIIEGHVAHARDARPAVGSSELLLRPDLLTLPAGQQYTISAEVIQSDPLTNTSTDAEGVIRTPRAPSREYVKRSGVATAMSAITGAAILGGRGALWGGALGAAAAGGWWFLRHHHVDLNAGSELTVRLERTVKLVPSDKGEGTTAGAVQAAPVAP